MLGLGLKAAGLGLRAPGLALGLELKARNWSLRFEVCRFMRPHPLDLKFQGQGFWQGLMLKKVGLRI